MRYHLLLISCTSARYVSALCCVCEVISIRVKEVRRRASPERAPPPGHAVHLQGLEVARRGLGQDTRWLAEAQGARMHQESQVSPT